MAISNLLDTNTVSFSDVLGNGKLYEVPPFQRDYSWKEDNWEDLWSDIESVTESDTVHYMGSIVLQNKGDRHYTIIDGQQRLATISLIVLAIIQNLKDLIDQHVEQEQNQERIDLLSKKFLGDKDPASLTYSAKLSLNENNNSFYQSYLMILKKPLNEKALQDSDLLLWHAYNFFKERIRQRFKSEVRGELLASFLNRVVAEKLMFIQIVVQDELSAYTVFETLNARGVGLSVTDLLKNYLFSIATRVDLVHVKNKWRKVIDVIGLDTFPAFLRHYWIAKHKLIRQEYLFKAVKEKIRTSPNVIDLLDDLENNALVYAALTNSSDPLWRDDREQRRRVKELELFKERQSLPMLLAAYATLKPDEFTKVLKIVSVVTFRYTVVSGLNTNPKEQIYAQAASKITQGEYTNAHQIAQSLKPIYVVDRDFKNDFSTLSISTKGSKRRLARYTLFALENHSSEADLDYEDNPATIEHILPENPTDTWLMNFPASTVENYVYRIGNYTLLEADKNRECSTRSFDDKKTIYSQSQYELSKDIIANEWTPNTLDKRQSRLADRATSIWRVSQLDK
ncbi:MAG: DUF262 domain-containing protein [Bacteroidetes bacterium]|nr:DUF262 domain-containing protein [Fibrella sp.]